MADKINEVVKRSADFLTNLQSDDKKPNYFRRDVILDRLTLDESEIEGIFDFVSKLNFDAQKLQIANEYKLGEMKENEIAEAIGNVMVPYYEIYDELGGLCSGLGTPNREYLNSKNGIKSIFISTSQGFNSFTNGINPQNYIHFYLSFEKPSLALNLQHFPSNPTETGSIVNIFGKNENWVISCQKQFDEFMQPHKNSRKLIHSSGVYDVFLWFLFAPLALWIAYRVEQEFTVFSNIDSGVASFGIVIYSMIFGGIIARLIFQYFRWLFPLNEFVSRKKTKSAIQRGIVGFITLTVFGGVIYDAVKWAYASIGN